MDARHTQVLLCVYRSDLASLRCLLRAELFALDEPLTRDYKTALHWAVLLHRLDAAAELLSLGAEPDIADYEGFTPLMCAVAQASSSGNAFARLLLAYGADPKFSTKLTGFDSALDMAEASFASNPDMYIHIKQELATQAVWNRKRTAIIARSRLKTLRLS